MSMAFYIERLLAVCVHIRVFTDVCEDKRHELRLQSCGLYKGIKTDGTTRSPSSEFPKFCIYNPEHLKPLSPALTIFRHKYVNVYSLSKTHKSYFQGSLTFAILRNVTYVLHFICYVNLQLHNMWETGILSSCQCKWEKENALW
jgi:hypothetical protein